jgi:hypothetical protein
LPLGRDGINGLYLQSIGQSLSGSVLDSWADALGIGPTWSFLGSGRPTVTNGIPLFDGGDDSGALVGAALNWSKNVTGITLLTVAETAAVATAGGQVVLVSTGTSATSNRCGLLRDSSAGKIRYVGRRLDADAAALIDDGVSSTTLYTIDIAAFDYAAAKLFAYQNGTAVALSPLDPFQTAGATSNTASLSVTLGSSGAAANFFHGNIRAVACFVGAISSATQLAVSRVIGTAYGITTA